jgi:hypothetical protein
MDGDDYNECGPHGFRTTGPLIPLAGKTVTVPLNMGPAVGGDLHAEYEPHWFADDGFFPDEDDDFDNFAAACDAAFNNDMKWPDRYGNHSLPIFSSELLFAFEGAKKVFDDECDGDENVLA